MARKRQRAKDRKQKLHRENIPGSLDHASGEVEEVEAAIVAGAGGKPVEPAPEGVADEPVDAVEPDDAGEPVDADEPVDRTSRSTRPSLPTSPRPIPAEPAKRWRIAEPAPQPTVEPVDPSGRRARRRRTRTSPTRRRAGLAATTPTPPPSSTGASAQGSRRRRRHRPTRTSPPAFASSTSFAHAGQSFSAWTGPTGARSDKRPPSFSASSSSREPSLASPTS